MSFLLPYIPYILMVIPSLSRSFQTLIRASCVKFYGISIVASIVDFLDM